MKMSDVLGIILGGGVGKRLYPLTAERAKPAVPLAGKYRLIDIPISNCFHAGIEKIAILTQFNSASLHRHIWNTYHRDIFTRGWIQILAAEQTPRSHDWYQGTADAVRKQILEIRSADAKYILILAGDHLYRMDYHSFLEQHVASGAEISVAVQPVPRELVSGLGILKLNEEKQITNFIEKPKSEEELADFENNTNPEKPYMASMGIYVYNADVLYEFLEKDGDDFGHNLIPEAIRTDRRVFGYVFDGYWEDIGTIRRFYQVNLEMATPNAPFGFYDAQKPIYTHARFLPGSEVYNARLHNVLLSDGCRIDNATVKDSIIGLRSIVGSEATINESIIMGADYFETDNDRAVNKELGRPDMGIGAHSVIRGAIVDKNARIGKNVTIRSLADREDFDNGNWVARDSIVIIPKGAILPDNTVI